MPAADPRPASADPPGVRSRSAPAATRPGDAVRADGGAGHDHNVPVAGSGSGGSATVLRATERGHRVWVLQAGARLPDDDVARTSGGLRRYLFAAAAGCHRILRMPLLRNTFVLPEASVGGGSPLHADSLDEPPDAVFADRATIGEPDRRPPLRSPHVRRAAVPPGPPVVGARAPGTLRPSRAPA